MTWRGRNLERPHLQLDCSRCSKGILLTDLCSTASGQLRSWAAYVQWCPARVSCVRADSMAVDVLIAFSTAPIFSEHNLGALLGWGLNEASPQKLGYALGRVFVLNHAGPDLMAAPGFTCGFID